MNNFIQLPIDNDSTSNIYTSELIIGRYAAISKYVEEG